MPRRKKQTEAEKLEFERQVIESVTNDSLLSLTIHHIQMCAWESSPEALDYKIRDLYLAALNKRLLESKWMDVPITLDY